MIGGCLYRQPTREFSELRSTLIEKEIREHIAAKQGVEMMPEKEITEHIFGHWSKLVKKHGRDNLEDTFLKLARSKNET